MQKRIKYLDAAKFIGIFFIYIVHFGSPSGYAYKFIFTFVVHLFFFLSGFSENLSNSDMPWYKYILKSIKSILIPFYLFAFASVVIHFISANSYTQILPDIICVLKGCIRNQFFAPALWFLTCLFVMRIAFYFLRKLFDFKVMLLIVCFSLFLISLLFDKSRPSMLYNVDSACYYIVFYALGYCCFDVINSFLSFDTVTKKITSAVVGVISFGFTLALFFEKNLFYTFGENTALHLISNFLSPIIIISLVLIVSRFIEDVDIFLELGKNTLFLCGSEYIIKLLVSTLLKAIGLGINFTNPISVYTYNFILLYLCYKFLVPVEKAVFKKLKLLK